MNEVPGMNIIIFADSLGMPVVNLNIFRMCLIVIAPENQLLIAQCGLWAFIAWSEGCICIKSERGVLTQNCSEITL